MEGLQDTNNTEKKVSLNDFNYIRGLGEGAFGRVVLVKSREEGSQRLMALKQLRKTRFGKEQLIREQKILKCVRKTPFCARLLASFQTADYAYLLTDYHSQGSLHDQIDRATKFTGQQLTLLAAEMCEALLYLHKNGITHLDVKPMNIMFDERGHSRLIDFGLALHDSALHNLRRPCGTPSYWAPELFQTPFKVDKMVDWWALGVTLLLVVMTYNPLDPDSDEAYDYLEALKLKVTEFNIEERASSFRYGVHSWGLKRFVNDLLRKDPARRLGATEDQVRSHYLFKINRLLEGPHKWHQLRTGRMPPPLPVAPRREVEGSIPAPVTQWGVDVRPWPDQSNNEWAEARDFYDNYDTCYLFEEDKEEGEGEEDKEEEDDEGEEENEGEENKGEEKTGRNGERKKKGVLSRLRKRLKISCVCSSGEH